MNPSYKLISKPDFNSNVFNDKFHKTYWCSIAYFSLGVTVMFLQEDNFLSS